MNLPQQMTAMTISAPGGPEVLRAQMVPVPGCGADELLIRVAAAGVNGPDLAQRRGVYDPPAGHSPIPGLEVAGVVARVGAGVSGWAPGQGAAALTNGGGYAEFVAVPAGQALPIPDGLAMATVAGLPETYFTVMQTLVMRAGLEPGMSVLVHGAAGGIGGAAVAMARLLGARPIAVVSSDEKADYALALGAEAAIVHGREDFVARALELTGGKGADRIVDVTGGEATARNIEAAARGGHIVLVATQGGGSATLPLNKVLHKQLTLSGSTLRPQSAATKAAIAAQLRRLVWPHLQAPGYPKPTVTTFLLADAAAAHRRLEERGFFGKAVLVTAFGQRFA
jgi:putative PIG3 family NAD(P)H quinone oxidoreductase